MAEAVVAANMVVEAGMVVVVVMAMVVVVIVMVVEVVVDVKVAAAEEILQGMITANIMVIMEMRIIWITLKSEFHVF